MCVALILFYAINENEMQSVIIDLESRVIDKIGPQIVEVRLTVS